MKIYLKVIMDLRFLLLILISISMSFTPLFADSNGVWLEAKDIRVGTFGSDETAGNFAFPNNLDVSNQLTTNNIISTTANITSFLEANSLEVVNRITTKSIGIEGNAGSLDLVGNDHAYLEFYPQGLSTRKGWIGFGSAGTEVLSIQSESDNLVLNPNGNNVGVGTTNPTQKLDINGNVRIRSALYNDGPIYENGNRVATRDYVDSSGTSVSTRTITKKISAWRWPSGTVNCDSNEVVVGGGASCNAPGGWMFIAESKPITNGWYAQCDTPEKVTATLDVYAICMKK